MNMWMLEGFSGFDLMERIFPLLFLVVFGIIVAALIRGVAKWNKNNHSPRLTVPARVASRRTRVSHSDTVGVDNGMSHSSTHYYATFEFDSGDRQEFTVSGQEYGQLAEGDVGLLSFQGTRFLGFERR